ncbi:MAG: response regulator [Planctomycetes bacterium]|nr:response regulator [Planctomycetota bacterium]MCB9888066.1 response regulator [Planctomycetota bacterium]
MPELFWFLMGSALTLAATFFLTRIREPVPEPTAAPTTEEPVDTAPSAPRRFVLTDSRTLEELAIAVRRELVTLVSGVESHAQTLGEDLGCDGEQLWHALRQLRLFTEKLRACAPIGSLPRSPMNIRALLAATRRELDDYSPASLPVHLQLAPSLPRASGNPGAMRLAVLFVIEAMVALDPDGLSIEAHTAENDDDELQVYIRIGAELDAERHTTVAAESTGPGPEVTFGLTAARNLLAAQGAELSFDVTPGLDAAVCISLAASPESPAEGEETPAADSAAQQISRQPGVPTEPVVPESVAANVHPYGGVLIVESNPALRDILASEFGRARRNVIACGDGAAAQTLFGATPQRFELLVVEQACRRVPGAELVRAATRFDRGIGIVYVTNGPDIAVEPDIAEHPHLRVLAKPFGVMELRERVAEVLGSA